MSEEGKYGSVTLEEYDPQLWSCSNCFCGLCVESCPAYRELHNEAATARGLAQICSALLSGELNVSEISDEIVYSCVGCRWCETVCSMNTPLYVKHHGTRMTKVSGATMAEILRAAKIEQGGRIPKELGSAGRNFAKFGNPYGEGKKAKDDWVKSLDLPSNKGDTILYVGSLVPYEDNSRKMAEAVVALLKIGDIPFGVLGSEESDSGAFLRMMGAEGLFFEMVEHNIEVLRRHGVKRIICLSPHDFDAFRHYYDLDDVEVKHYTQLLWEKVEAHEIRYTKKVNKKMAYHDPCYLGRQNGIYEEPRKILLSIPGVELVEIEKSRETALCCGGGGTGLLLELPNVNIDKTRMDQIREVKPDYVVVACPNCYQMLESGFKSRNDSIAVKDVAQVMMEAL